MNRSVNCCCEALYPFCLSFPPKVGKQKIKRNEMSFVELGMKEEDMGMNSPLMWLRGDVGERALHCLNFQGVGVAPWMQPRFDATMLGMQNDLYQAMAAAAALQEMTPATVDPSKQALSSLLQLQQSQSVVSRPAASMQNQMLQESQSQPTFILSIPESQSHLQVQPQPQPLLIQQQLQHQTSFNNLQQQPQHHQPSALQHQQLNDHHQVSGVMPVLSQLTTSSQSQVQSPSLQSLSSMQQQSFADSNGNPSTNSIMSPLHSLLSSVPPDGTSHLLNVPRSGTLLSPTGWPPKRVAVDPVLSSIGSQCISPQLGPSNTNISPNSVSLPPFPGRECSIDQEGSGDPQNNLLFGVNIDSSSLLIQNEMSNLRGVVSESDSTSVPFGSSNYVSTTNTDFPSNNPTMTPSSCISESGFPKSSENVGQANLHIRTFVKVNDLNSVSIHIFLSHLIGLA